MAVYTCLDPNYPQTWPDWQKITVDEAAPGEYAGQTLNCDLGNKDPFGDPTYDSYTFPEPEPVEPPPNGDGSTGDGTTEPPAEPPAEPPPELPGVDGNDVAAFLGQSDDVALAWLAQEHTSVITALARAYTRGAGFDEDGTPNEEIGAVITAATARLVANPEQIPYDIGGVSFRGGFAGWTLAETLTLNAYRKRAA